MDSQDNPEWESEEEALQIAGPLTLGSEGELTKVIGNLSLRESEHSDPQQGLVRQGSDGTLVFDSISCPGYVLSDGKKTMVMPHVPRSIMCTDDSGHPYYVQFNNDGSLKFDPKVRKLHWEEKVKKPISYLFCYEGKLNVEHFEEHSGTLVFNRNPICTEENGKNYDTAGTFTPPRAGRYRFFVSITLAPSASRGSRILSIVDKGRDAPVLYSKVEVPPLSRGTPHTIECSGVDLYLTRKSSIVVTLSCSGKKAPVVLDTPNIVNRASITELPVFHRHI